MRLSRMLMVTVVLTAIAVAVGVSRDAAATQVPIEMKFACALKSNGLMRYVSNLNQCKSTETQVTIHPGPISVCVNPDGTVRKIPPYQCQKPGVVLTLPPASGTVYFCAANSNGQLRYVTSPSQCTSKEFPVFVGPNNAPPVAVADSYSTDEDTPLTVPAPGVLANDTDADGDPLTAVLVSGPSHAAPSGFTLNANGSFSYTPAADYNGSDSFTYKDNDTKTTGNTVTVSLTINAVNDAPVNHLPAAQSVNQDSSLTLSSGNGNQLSVSDVDAGSDTGFEVQLSVSHGTLTLSQTTNLTVTGNGTASVGLTGALADANAALNGLTYTPTSGYFGPDTLAITSNDHGATGSGGAKTDSDNLSITVTHVNHAPFATADAYSTDEDTPLNVSAPGVLTNDTDLDGDTLHAVLDSGPSHAAPSGFTLNADGSFSYTPAADYNGPDSFTYHANDGTADSNTVTVTLTVNAVNDAPVNHLPAAQSVNQDSSLTLSSGNGNQLSVSDVDAGSDPGFEVQLSVSHGTLTLSQTTNLTVTGNGTASVGLTGALADANAALNGLTYTPTSGYFGPDTLAITSNDHGATGSGGAKTDSDNLSITVTHVNHAPFATADAYSTDENTPLNVSAPGVLTNDTDLDGDTLHAVLDSGPSHAAPSGFTLNADGSFSYTPAADYSGSDSFTYHANDGTADSNTVTVSLTINAVNQPPVNHLPGPQSVNEDSTLTLSSGDSNAISISDPDAGSGLMKETLGVSHGTLSLNGTSGLIFSTGDGTNDPSMVFTGTISDINAALDGMTYTPASNYNGPDSLSITTDDQGNTGAGGAKTDSDSLAITVNPVNDAPTDIQLSNSSIAENQPSATDVGTLTTTDPDSGDTHTYTLENAGCSGSYPDNNSFQIGGVNGDKLQSSASFDFETKSSYTICVRSTDSGALSFDEQFIISITDANDAPSDITLVGDSIAENQPSGTTIGTLSATDQDVGQTHTFSFSTSCGVGPFDNGSFSITGNTLKSGVSFNYEAKNTYTICVRTTDNGSPNLSFDKSFTIHINDANDAPVGVADSYSGAIGNTVAVLGATATGPHVTLSGNSLISNDTDEDNPSGTFAHALSAVAETVTSTGGGSVQINTDGSFVYTPGVGDKNQDDTFTYHVTDGSLTSAGTATVHIDNFLVWYVDNASAAATHDGRSSSPLLGLTGLNGAGGSGDSDGPGDYIFLYQGSGNYGGGIPLEANQNLWGQPHGLTVNGNNLVAAGGSNPVVTNASGTGVGLASGVDVQGLNISGTSGDAINGVAVTTATVGTTNAVNISSAGGDGVDLSGAASGNISIASPITGSTGDSVTVSGRSGGTVAFSGSISDSGTGISLSNNTGATINFTGGLTLNSAANFSASGGGTVNVTGANNTIGGTTPGAGPALNVANTTIGASGLNFKKISATGGANGIVLNTTGSGALTVSGDGASDPANTTRGNTTAKAGGGTITLGSGGTIQNTTGAGIALTSTGPVSLTSMRVQSPAAGSQTANNGNNGITASTVNGLNLDNVLVTGFTGNSGLRGTSVTNLQMQHVDIDGNGTATGTETNDNWNVRLNNLSGNCGNGTAGCGWSNSLFFNSRENIAGIVQTGSTSTSMTISNSEFRDTTTFANPANDAFSFEANGTASSNILATGSTFKNVEVTGFQYSGNDNDTGTVKVQSSVFENTGTDVNIAHGGGSGGNSTLNFDVSGNTERQLTGNPASTVAVNIFLGGLSGASSSMVGTIKNNTIGAAAVSGSGSHVGDGIDVNSTGAGTITATVSGNTVHQIHQGDAFFAIANQSSHLNVSVHNNSFNVDQSSTGLAGGHFVGGAAPADSATTCVDMNSGSNTFHGDTTYTGVEMDALGGSNGIRLVGYGGAQDDFTAIQNFIVAQNTSVTPAPIAVSGNGAHISGVANCGVTFPS